MPLHQPTGSTSRQPTARASSFTGLGGSRTFPAGCSPTLPPGRREAPHPVTRDGVTIGSPGLDVLRVVRGELAKLVQLIQTAAAPFAIGGEQPIRRVDQRGGHRHVLPALAKLPRDHGLCIAGSHAALNEQGKFERLEAFALLVLDHLVVAVRRVVDERGDVELAYQLGRPQPPRAEVQHPPIRLLRMPAHGDGLPHATLPDGPMPAPS